MPNESELNIKSNLFNVLPYLPYILCILSKILKFLDRWFSIMIYNSDFLKWWYTIISNFLNWFSYVRIFWDKETGCFQTKNRISITTTNILSLLRKCAWKTLFFLLR